MSSSPNAVPDAAVTVAPRPPASPCHVKKLVDYGIIPTEEWQAIDAETRRQITEVGDAEKLFSLLAELRLLTEYQIARIRAGESGHLVLGNYRLLDRIGAGGMGTVFRGEHRVLRHPVAVKIMHASPENSRVQLHRFFIEMRTLAQIRHPNIVAALDAGTTAPRSQAELGNELGGTRLHYLVMEHVEGTHLEAMVGQAPLSIAQTCELAWQIAGALEETHKRQLVHRDIKPSNILVTPRHVAKLLDFGLAIHFAGSRLTSPGTLLGTLSYMAPEQIADSGNVDIRADIFGLGATVFFCLTGKPPFPSEGNMTQQVAARLTQAAPAVRSLRPDVSPELDAVIARMLAHHCTDRFSTPQSLIRALSPFVNASARYADRSVGLAESEILPSSAASVTRPRLGSMNEMERSCPRVLIVDDEAPLRQLCTQFFRAEGFDCQTACNGKEALTALAARTFSLVLLDIDMPEMSGRETLRHLRQDAPAGNPKVIMMSGGVPPDEMSALLALGADDYVTKPLNRLHLVARVRAALAHKATDDRSETLNQQLLRLNAELEDRVAARSSDLFQVRNALLFALAQAVETRARDTTRGHLARVARGAVALARQARNGERFTRAIDGAFVRVLAVCAPLHDIGYIALPDHIVHAPGPLGPEDRIILQAHTTIGADTLASVGKRDSSAGAFWRMAIDITRHHHERFDGTGYPDRLAGHDIPLPARLVAIADTYDMLRTAGELGYALAHNAAVEWMVGGARGRFDPALVQAFQECEHDFEEISRTSPSRDGSSPQDCPLVSQLSLGTSGPFG